MKMDANRILREQGVDALRSVMDAAVPFNGHDVTSEADADRDDEPSTGGKDETAQAAEILPFDTFDASRWEGVPIE
jgi:hypothetical protein